MVNEYPPYRVFEAQDLFVLDGHTYQAVATATGIPMSTLKRWGAKYDWTGKRSELREAESQARADTIRLRAKLVRDCLAADRAKPLDVFAAAKLNDAALEAEKFRLERRVLEQPVDLEKLSTSDAVAALERAVVGKIAGMLADPARLELKAVGELRRALELVLAAKEADETAARTPQPLSEDVRTRLRAARGLLGDGNGDGNA